MEIIRQIPITLNVDEIRRRLRMGDSEHWADVQALIDRILPSISPKAAYSVGYIDQKLEDSVVVNGVVLKSRVLRKNLENVERVFLYLVTVGSEMEEHLRNAGDLLEQFYLDTIANCALNDARIYLEEQLKRKYRLDGISFMSPGSLADWPISEQRALFSIFGEDVEAAIGVRLNESLLMIPSKSVSGIFFPTEVRFYNCQLCPRQSCTSRKAPFNREMADEYGITS